MTAPAGGNAGNAGTGSAPAAAPKATGGSGLADALPYGVRDIKLTPYTDALGTVLSTKSVDLPYIQTLNFSEAEEFTELRGDDKLITTRGKGAMVNWDMESGGLPINAWKVVTGGEVKETGLTPNRVVELQKKATTTRPWFRIDGKIISDSGGDILVRIYRCRANGDVTANFTDGEFQTSSINGVGYPLLDDANDLLYSIFRRESAEMLSLTPAPNPVQSPLNVTVGVVTANSVELTWTPVIGATEYKVEYSEGTTGTWTAFSPNPTTASATVTGLKAKTTYKIRISTTIGADTSVPCPEVQSTTV
jgi:hypothetical protein